MAQQESLRRARDIVEGRLISAHHLALALGWSEQAVDSARVAGRMFGFKATLGNHVYPAFYADPGIPFGDLEAVTLALGAASASGKWQFFYDTQNVVREANAVAGAFRRVPPGRDEVGGRIC